MWRSRGVNARRCAVWKVTGLFTSQSLSLQRVSRPWRSWSALALVGILFFAVGCNQNMTFQAMGNQPRYNPLVPSDFFADGQSARPIVPGTVARGHVQDDPLLFTGKVGNQDAPMFPFAVTREVMVRGRERYDIFCAPCHDRTGSGKGMIVQRGFTPPPSFHIDSLRSAPEGHFFDVITNGLGSMPSYGDQIPVRDRWAIIAYIRALQLSQNARIDDAPPEERDKLRGK